LTKAEESAYSGNRSDIGSSQELTIEFNAFPIYGYEVDKAAAAILASITGVNPIVSKDTNKHRNDGSVQGIYTDANGNSRNVAKLDSSDYRYGILGFRDASNQTYDQQSTTSEKLQAYSQAADKLTNNDGTPASIDDGSYEIQSAATAAGAAAGTAFTEAAKAMQGR
jgi:hypothetical protein